MRWTTSNCDGDGPAPSDQDLLECVADRAMVDAESWISQYDPEVEAHIDTSAHVRAILYWKHCWHVAPDRMRALEPYYHQKFDEAVRLLGNEELLTDDRERMEVDWVSEGF